MGREGTAMKAFQVSVVVFAMLGASACDAREEPLKGPPAAASASSAAVPTTSVEGAALDRLIDLELVGGNLAFFEAISGPAKRVGDWGEGQSRRDYEVEGCDISLTTEGQTISAITFSVTPQCNPGGFGMQFAGKTLGQAAAEFGGGRYVAGCLSMCGNAADPTYALEVPGYRANGFLNYSVEAMATTDAEWDRLHAWKDQMVASHGEDYVLSDMTYQCSDADAEGARAATQNLQIISVTVSRDDKLLVCR